MSRSFLYPVQLHFYRNQHIRFDYELGTDPGHRMDQNIHDVSRYVHAEQCSSPPHSRAPEKINTRRGMQSN